jgi:hypothetical protein
VCVCVCVRARYSVRLCENLIDYILHLWNDSLAF